MFNAPMKICIIGTGYVGLVTGTCFAEIGHDVICVDNAPEKVKMLNSGQMPIFEPGLEEMVKRNAAAGRLKFTSSTKEGVEKSDVVFIAVPTPPQPDGSVDLSFMEKVSREIAEGMDIIDGYTGTSADLLTLLMDEWWRRVGEQKASGICKLMQASSLHPFCFTALRKMSSTRPHSSPIVQAK